jgi:prepilin-type N-terminal cleavage/methylation domain-containing protein
MHISLGRSGSYRERGDTIVEVLIAIAVISLVLGGAYVTTNRSLQATRAAQERSIALKLAESQLERIKGLAASDPPALFGAPSPFCIDSSTGLPVDADDEACAVDESGAPTTEEPVFHLSVSRSGNDFTLTESWFNVNGQITDNLELRYRVYE